MSSESISLKDRGFFLWQNNLNIEDYIRVTYYLETPLVPDIAVLGMAKEQSATSVKIRGIPLESNITAHTARIISVETIGETGDSMLPQYRLKTPVYQPGVTRPSGYWQVRATLAFPIANFGTSLTNLWNAVGGELHRLGFLNALRLIDMSFPDSYLARLPGPRYGIPGIRSQLAVPDRPLFCRSTRPAVSLTTDDMIKINELVLRGGFDAIKDDELTCDTPRSPFKERIKKMVAMVRRVEDATGEKKYYVANVTDDLAHSLEMADMAKEAGASALLVSPAIQGIAIAGYISQRTGLPILSHNSWADPLTRHPRFGIRPGLYVKMQRVCGADMVLLPPEFATGYMDKAEEQECITACTAPLGNLKPTLPIIAGGKTPKKLQQYLSAVGGIDFMIIAATSVDTHPGGIEAGARAFRESWTEIAGKLKAKNKPHK